MAFNLEELAPFKEICQKICLNIPESYQWQWDEGRKMGVVVLTEEDAELVFFPLFKEFQHHWNFSSQTSDAPSISEQINDRYGLMPGQVFFTSYPLCDLVLSVAWWPWGNENKVSMRIGLTPVKTQHVENGIALKCLSKWLNLAEASSSG